jgi:flotillin
VTGEITKIAAQVPALLESLTGLKLSDLMGQVKPMAPRKDDDAPKS